MNKTFKSVTANQIPYLGHQDCHITKTDTFKNKIAQGDVNIFSHLTFYKFVYVFFLSISLKISHPID